MRPVAALLLLPALAFADAPKPAARVAIDVTARGFEPAAFTVAAGTPITLVVTRKTEQTCAKSIVVTLDDKHTIERALPINTPVEITTTFPKAGTVAYACTMNMRKGVITVQ